MRRYNETTIARVTIYGAGGMTYVDRRRLAAWLRQHARDLLAHGHGYSKRFTGRYLGYSDRA